jgi:hypothetical protein
MEMCVLFLYEILSCFYVKNRNLQFQYFLRITTNKHFDHKLGTKK